MTGFLFRFRPGAWALMSVLSLLSPVLETRAGDEVKAAPSSYPEPTTATTAADPFPSLEGLRGHVEFWKKTFGTWGLGQVALHDKEHPSLVYEVLELPGNVTGAYTPEQERFIRARREALEARLQRLEQMAALHAPLTDDEKELAILITTNAGTDAIGGVASRVRSQRGLRERFRTGLEISGRFDAIFRQIFREAGLPEDLACLPHVESSFQVAVRSSAGAVGMWQFTRGAGRRFMNINASLDERWDPVAAARGAAQYLKRSYELLGDWALAVTSYNHGVEGMLRAKGSFGNDFERIVREYDGRSFGFASKNFYAEFLAAREIARDAARFFPDGLKVEPPMGLDRVVLEKSAPAHTLAQRYGVNLRDLAALNPAWTRRAVRGGRPLPAGTEVWLPEGTLERISAKRNRATAVKRTLPNDASGRAVDAAVHVVRRGETLLKIAASYGVRLTDLLLANEITERSILRPGQHLQIPLTR